MTALVELSTAACGVSVGLLLEALEDRDVKIRRAAVYGLRQRWSRAAPSVLGVKAAVPLQRLAADRSLPLAMRSNALFCVTRLGASATVDGPSLLQTMEDEHLRRVTLLVLRFVRTSDSRLLDVVASLLASEDREDGLLAIEALSSQGDRRCVGPALNLLLQPEPAIVRERVAYALLNLPGALPVSARELEKALRSSCSSSDTAIREGCGAILLLLWRLLEERDEELAGETLAIAEKRLETYEIGAAALVAAVAWRRRDAELGRKALPALVACLDGVPPRDHVRLLDLAGDLANMEGMGPLSPQVLEDVRERLAQMCGMAGSASPELVAAWERCLRRLLTHR